MELRVIGPDGVREAPLAELPELLRQAEGVVWLDVPGWDDETARLLTACIGLHPMAGADCAQRNHVPKVHAYAGHALLVLHSPEPEPTGHVHYVELDQLVAEHYVVTVHGPLSPDVPIERALHETRAVQRRLEEGRLRPQTGWDLSHALVSTVVRTHERQVGRLAELVGRLEQRLMAGTVTRPEDFLEELFRARHELLVTRTMATQSQEVFARLIRVVGKSHPAAVSLLEDQLDQYQRVHGLADGQLDFLSEVIDSHRARTDTKMMVAAERLAVIAAVTLPVTAVSSVLGMNVIVNSHTRPVSLIVLLVLMTVMSLWLLRWAKRQGWW